MRSRNWKSVPAMVALVLASGTTSVALAQCGLPTKLVKPSSWTPAMGGAHLMRADFDDHDGPSIVGMWHVSFIAETAVPPTAPTGAMIDNALVVWHSDGTEIMNSMRPPQDGNFCLGVWERVGPRTYKLNHIPWFAKQFPTGPDDPGTTIGPSVGPTQITEEVTLSPDGQHYSGTFTLVAYTTTNTVFQTFTGKVSGTRITVSTKESDLM
jgi:hypothetical protein